MEPEFPNGSIVTIDPNEPIYDGAFVVARIAERFELPKLRIRNDALFLVATGCRDCEAARVDISALRGVVTQCTDARRKSVRKFNSI